MQEDNVHHEQSPITKVWLFLLDLGQTFLITGTVFLVITMFLFRPFQVSGNSMYSNFQDKEYILTNLLTLRFGDPKPGDVIVFRSPTNHDKDFIKRVIAVPGDTIYLQDGYVFVNDLQLNEEYLDPGIKTYGGTFLQEGDNKLVPQDHFFVMGDNRTDSSDSRQWGFVPKNEIKGISIFVYWPPESMHIINNPYQ